MFRKTKIGLALGAGGARGLAHIGVLKAMERVGIRISFISGSSIGALVGGLYAHCLNAAELENLVPEIMNNDFFRKAGLPLMRQVFHDQPEGFSQRLETFIKKAYVQALIATRPAILDTSTFKAMIDYIVPDINIEDLPLPFCALSTDLRSGRPVLFRHGPLRDAIYASTAIPGAISPLKMNNLLLADGGILNMVPVQPLFSMGADLVYAVNVEMEALFKGNESNMKAIDILYRIEDIKSDVLKEAQLNAANLVLSPKLGRIHWSDFSRATEMIQIGYDEIIKCLDEMRNLARRRIFPLKNRKKFKMEFAFDWIEI
ncbi:MAG: patatin-like phospholipase family protein [Deltaproteobacteria bacterium]|nr:patatin-like phospholipase family protein [Deltaproteobacteria bacterium]MBW2051386.1 patatin-like phospholipase family protein [Deltaproteobacteria bacterium]MBW2141277.1 patatin-like phospholipase family protein [Deltaproteobacteria bacterium]MBW2322733.1 patatin-like phospholipase family protein [Deltaproteobacteria bacterium]